MSAPRNNLDDVRAKFHMESMVAPATTKSQTAKAFKFKAAPSSAQPVVIPHATNAPPQRSVPPTAQPSRQNAPTHERHSAPKRPSLDGSGNPSPKRVRRIESGQAQGVSTPSGPTRVKARDAVMTTNDITATKENHPLTVPSSRKPHSSTSVQRPVSPHFVPNSSHVASSSDANSKTLDQLRILHATNLSSELDYVKKLILVRQGLAIDQDPFVVEQFMTVLSERNKDVKATIEKMESGRLPLQANVDLSQMSLEQLRILLIQNLTQELQHAKSMLDADGGQDPVVLQMFIDMLSKRNADTKAAIACREQSSTDPIIPPPVSSAHSSHSYVPPTLVTPVVSLHATSSSAKAAPIPICVDDDDDMDFDTSMSTAVPVVPLQAIHNTVPDTPRVRVRAPPLPVPDPDVDAKNSPYAAEALQVLKKTFGLQGFRKHQLAAITATLSGKDVFVLMPTGGGKSLCYQVPAVCQKGTTRGVTIVVSPLIALMNDQVAHLQAKNVSAVAFNSNNTKDSAREERERLVYEPGKDLPALVYVTPEKLDKNVAFCNLLKKLHYNRRIARFVIDEVHCLATWGRDFRDSYKTLSRLRTDFPGVPIMALTATAHKNNVDDIISQLNINDCLRLTQSFNRPNLRYTVKRKPKAQKLLEEIYKVISTHSGETGIIYCLARNTCEEVAKNLREGYNVKAKHYHARMSPDDKAKTQEAWQNGSCKVIVATIAFGMGIDKANVRFVIHHTMPKSLEGYYQETGRAGRDGNESECVLFYSPSDFQVLKKQIWEDKENKLSDEDKRRQEEEVRVVMRFCMNDTDCRRSQVLTFFDETFDAADCHAFCDNCKDSAEHEREMRDFTSYAQDALRLVQEMMAKNSQINITQAQCVAVFVGSKAKDIKDKGFDVLEHAGKGSILKKGVIDRLFECLLVEGALYIESLRNQSGWSNSYLKLGPQNILNDFFAGKTRLRMSVKAGTAINVDSAEQRAGRGKRQRNNAKPVNRKRRQQNPYDSDADSGERNDVNVSNIAMDDDDPIVVDEDNDEDDDYFPFDYDDIRAMDDAEETLVDRSVTASSSDAGLADETADVVMEALKRRRQEIARSQRIPDDSIADDNLLWMIATSMPKDLASFDAILEDYYGDEAAARNARLRCRVFLDVCVRHSMEGSSSKPPSRTNSASMSAPRSNGPLNAEVLSKFKFKKP